MSEWREFEFVTTVFVSARSEQEAKEIQALISKDIFGREDVVEVEGGRVREVDPDRG